MVSVPPEVQLPNARIGQRVGRDTVLECIITSSPQDLYYWEKDGRRLAASSKHSVDAYDETDGRLVLSLRVRQVTPGDYGVYNCVASNSLGVAHRAMTLYGTPLSHRVSCRCVRLFVCLSVCPSGCFQSIFGTDWPFNLGFCTFMDYDPSSLRFDSQGHNVG